MKMCVETSMINQKLVSFVCLPNVVLSISKAELGELITNEVLKTEVFSHEGLLIQELSIKVE